MTGWKENGSEWMSVEWETSVWIEGMNKGMDETCIWHVEGEVDSVTGDYKELISRNKGIKGELDDKGGDGKGVHD